jgi:hypothetical protein
MVSMVAGRGRNDRVQLYFVGKQLPTTWDLYPDPGWEDAGEFQPQPSGINTPEGPEIMATPQDLAVTQLGITGSNGPGDPKTGYGNAGRSQLFALYPTFANPDVSEFWTTSKHNEVQNSYWEPWNKLALVSDSAALLTSSQIDKAGHIAVWAVGAFGVDDRGRGTPVGLQWTTNVGAQYPSDPITSGFEAFNHGGDQLFGGLASARQRRHSSPVGVARGRRTRRGRCVHHLHSDDGCARLGTRLDHVRGRCENLRWFVIRGERRRWSHLSVGGCDRREGRHVVEVHPKYERLGNGMVWVDIVLASAERFALS